MRVYEPADERLTDLFRGTVCVDGIDQGLHGGEDIVNLCNVRATCSLRPMSKEAWLDDGQREAEARQSDDLTDVLARAASGEDAAWTELVQLYSKRLFALARSRLGSVELAEEVVQSVLVTVATKMTGGAYAESGRFEPWLFRVAMNRIRDEIRRQRRSLAQTNGHVPEIAIDSRAEDTDDRIDSLRRALQEIPDADREVIELRHHGQMSFKEIAILTDEPLGTLLARHHRALRKIRSLIEADATECETKRST